MPVLALFGLMTSADFAGIPTGNGGRMAAGLAESPLLGLSCAERTVITGLFMTPATLNIFASRLDAVCEEMGLVLRKAAFSPNIRDRLDFSCAVFDAGGSLCAQAAHIPVHLGSMAFAMQGIVAGVDWRPGDQLMLNDPYLGGTHLPDVTVIAPVFVEGQLCAFVVNRAHHADIGAASPGSMPISSRLDHEGIVIEPVHLVRDDEIVAAALQRVTAATRNQAESEGDFAAQIAANRAGVARLRRLIARYGVERFRARDRGTEPIRGTSGARGTGRYPRRHLSFQRLP